MAAASIPQNPFGGSVTPAAEGNLKPISIKFVLGVGGLWLILTALIEFGLTDIAAWLAALILASFSITHGDQINSLIKKVI